MNLINSIKHFKIICKYKYYVGKYCFKAGILLQGISHGFSHYEYWLDNFDNGTEPLQMPFKYAVELVCDYLGAGHAYMGEKFTYKAEYEWWRNKCSKPIVMHLQTKAFITMVLHRLKLIDHDQEVLNKQRLLQLYKQAENIVEKTNHIKYCRDKIVDALATGNLYEFHRIANVYNQVNEIIKMEKAYG